MAEQSIGKVIVVYGTVKAESQDGVERLLQPNSAVFLMDRINTGADGAISIVFSDNENTQLDLGRMTEMVVDESILATEELNLEDVTADIEAIQEALLSGEEIDIEATAAGGTAAAGAGGGGRPIVKIAVDGNEGEVTSGAETEGVTYDFTGSEQQIVAVPEIVIPSSPVPEPEPEAPVFEPVVLAAEPLIPDPVTTPPPATTPPPVTTPPPEEPELNEARVVEEEDLKSSESDYSDGNEDDNDNPEDAIVPDSKVITGDLGEGTWSIVSTTGLPSLTSQGDTIQYEIGGTTLLAYVDRISEDDQPVFTFDVQPDGSYTFTIIDQIDHLPGDGENVLDIDLSGTLQVVIGATPFTFDSGSMVVTAVDDVPVLTGDSVDRVVE